MGKHARHEEATCGKGSASEDEGSCCSVNHVVEGAVGQALDVLVALEDADDLDSAMHEVWPRRPVSERAGGGAGDRQRSGDDLSLSPSETAARPMAWRARRLSRGSALGALPPPARASFESTDAPHPSVP